MSELAIRAFTTYNRDAFKNRQGCYKRGDPVAAVPDGYDWGRCEQMPRFWRIRVPVEVWALHEYCQEHHANRLFATNFEQARDYWFRRRYHFSPTGLGASERRALASSWIVPVSWKTFKACVRVKVESDVLPWSVGWAMGEIQRERAWRYEENLRNGVYRHQLPPPWVRERIDLRQWARFARRAA